MLLIPAIDIKDGRCVRLRQGRMDTETVFSEDPLSMARRWAEAGARRLHVVDLDGAVQGNPVNLAVIQAIVEAVPDLPVQVGGGIRDEDTIEEYVGSGVRYVILGSKAAAAPHFVADVCVEFPGHIVIGLDAKDGRVATDGWSKLSNHDVLDLAQHFERDGVEAIIYTDISRDGMLTGLGLESTIALARSIHIPVIASGGLTGMDEVRALCAAEGDGVTGAIVGRALYEGHLDLAEAQALADQLSGST